MKVNLLNIIWDELEFKIDLNWINSKHIFCYQTQKTGQYASDTHIFGSPDLFLPSIHCLKDKLKNKGDLKKDKYYWEITVTHETVWCMMA